MLTEDELNWIRQVLSTDDSESKLTEDEVKWLKQVLGDDYEYDPLKLPPHYIRLKKTNFERNENKEIVRKELDEIREELMKFTPKELLELRNKNVRESQGIYNFSGIYIIHNRENDIYYVGQAERVFDRTYMHFVIDKGNPDIYDDYRLGDEFSISLIPLEKTSFSSQNELEDNAIRAYESFPNGYNRMPGNVMDKHIFKSDDYQKVADFLVNKIKGTELFLRLSNRRKRILYTNNLLLEHGLSLNANFINGFADVIKEYQKANKKNYKK